MPGPKPKEITLTQRQREILHQLIRREKSSQQLVRRAKTILADADQRNNQHNADLLGCYRRRRMDPWLSNQVGPES